MPDLIPLYTAAGKLAHYELSDRRGQPDVKLTEAEVSQIAAAWSRTQLPAATPPPKAAKKKADADAQ